MKNSNKLSSILEGRLEDDELEADTATNSEASYHNIGEEEDGDDAKNDDTEDNSKTTITTGKGRKDNTKWK